MSPFSGSYESEGSVRTGFLFSFGRVIQFTSAALCNSIQWNLYAIIVISILKPSLSGNVLTVTACLSNLG